MLMFLISNPTMMTPFTINSVYRLCITTSAYHCTYNSTIDKVLR